MHALPCGTLAGSTGPHSRGCCPFCAALQPRILRKVGHALLCPNALVLIPSTAAVVPAPCTHPPSARVPLVPAAGGD